MSCRNASPSAPDPDTSSPRRTHSSTASDRAAGDGREEGEPGTGSEHGRCGEHVVRRRRHPAHPRAYGVAHRGGHLGRSRPRAPRSRRTGCRSVRRAARPGRARTRLSRTSAVTAAGLSVGRCIRTTPVRGGQVTHHGRQPVAGPTSSSRKVTTPSRGRPSRRAAEEPHQLQRRLVGPVEVLEHEDRGLLGQPRSHLAEQSRPRRRGRLLEHRLELRKRLDDRAERGGRGDAVAGATPYERAGPAAPASALEQQPHQRRLAHPGLSARNTQRPAAVALDGTASRSGATNGSRSTSTSPLNPHPATPVVHRTGQPSVDVTGSSVDGRRRSVDDAPSRENSPKIVGQTPLRRRGPAGIELLSRTPSGESGITRSRRSIRRGNSSR